MSGGWEKESPGVFRGISWGFDAGLWAKLWRWGRRVEKGGSLFFSLDERGGVVVVNRRKVFFCNLIVRNLGVAR